MLNSSTEILFEKFEIVECLKKDNYSCVYVANHIYLGKKIILKTLNTENLNDKAILGRFKREAKILAQLDHPNLIKVLDFGTFNNNFYLSFEYFPSRNLREVIHNNNLSIEEKIKLLIQLLRALNFAHQNETIHRDIKPENILINSSLDLKIADFGLALVKSDHTLTQQSSIVGTPSYMSPEQIRGENLSPQSDIFSAGIVAYELFFSTNPFLGKDISETINNILNYKEELLFKKIDTLPELVSSALKVMLKKNPGSRAKNAEEVLKKLGIEPTHYHIPVQTKIRRKFNKSLMFTSVSVIILILIAAFLFINGNFGKDNFLTKLTEPSGLVDTVNQKVDTSFLDSVNNQKREPADETDLKLPGRLFVEASPWADIYVDNKKLDTTPLKDYIVLRPGTHRLRLVHPDYPPVNRRVVINPNKIESISVDFRLLAGYLDCKVNPWGEIYINGEHKGTTPLWEPIILAPGNYTLTIKNPEYEDIEENITITARDTLNYKLNFSVLKSSPFIN